jgi:hypothetical protein
MVSVLTLFIDRYFYDMKIVCSPIGINRTQRLLVTVPITLQIAEKTSGGYGPNGSPFAVGRGDHSRALVCCQIGGLRRRSCWAASFGQT